MALIFHDSCIFWIGICTSEFRSMVVLKEISLLLWRSDCSGQGRLVCSRAEVSFWSVCSMQQAQYSLLFKSRILCEKNNHYHRVGWLWTHSKSLLKAHLLLNTVWLVSVVNLIRSSISWEMGLWACLWRIILIQLVEVGRPTHFDWHWFNGTESWTI